MNESQMTAALGRLEKALDRAEAGLERQRASRAQAAFATQAKEAELAALQTRHAELKQAVAGGLRELDGILAGMAGGVK